MQPTIQLVIAEDQELIRKSLISLLKESPFIEIVGEAGNGKELLDLLKKTTPDLVLLDFEMPVMNGLESLSIISKRFPKVKVVMLSMHNEMGLVYELMLSGARAYLPKTCDVDSLVKTIVTVHAYGYYFCEHVSNSLLKGSLKNRQLNPLIGEKALSEREMQILQKLCTGLTNKEIAGDLHITARTVDFHRANIYSKTGSSNIAELVRYSIKNGLVDTEA